MTCVERASRNSLIAYSHLFEPRPERRSTLKKRRVSVDVQAVGVLAHELVASGFAAGAAVGLPAYSSTETSPEQATPSDVTWSSVPGLQATATATATDTEYALPWGWRPRRPSVGTAAKLAAQVPTQTRDESRIEQAKVPVRMQPYHPPSRLSRPVATFNNYDPNFLMPLPPRKQSHRSSRTKHHPARPTPPRPYRAMGDRHVTMQNSNQNAVGPAYAQMRRPTRPPMTSFNQMDQRQPSYEQWPRPPSSGSSSIRSNMSNASHGMMNSPVSSRSSFSSYDSSDVPRRLEHGAWQRPMLLKQSRRRREPGELFQVLPTEVLQLILVELKKSHLRANSDSCATCMTRDLFSVAMTCRRLSKAAHNALYEDIQIVGADSMTHKKRFKTTAGTRLVLLRRTLRANADLAALVRTLKVPAVPTDTAVDKYQDKVASVIMACPNFERLLGFHQPYDHSFNRLFHALSTRENLKEMNWFLESVPAQQKQGRSRSQSNSAAAPIGNEADVDEERSTAFFDLHMNWSRLTALSIHCAPGAVLDGISMFVMTLANMPALQSLHLSDLPTTVFNDATLLSLPPLQTLSLSNLQGVSSAGLAAFARRPSSHGIKKLTLRHLGIDSLPALGRLFSNLTAMESFTFVQSHAPELPKDEVIWLYPYLASPSLQKLHWDVPTWNLEASEADRILAKSITFQGYPALRSLRTPSDPEGVFQSLCAPLERVDIASDKYRGLIARIPDRIKAPEPSPPMSPTSPLSSFGFGKQSSNTKFTNDPPTPIEMMPPVESQLAQSRLAAQARIEAAKSVPRFQINVIDDDGTVVNRFGLAGFIGQVESKIRYNMKPDPGATDENGGLTTITDLLKDGGEALKDREGCTGRWLSWNEGVTNDKKERWWHTERGRWQAVEMS